MAKHRANDIRHAILRHVFWGDRSPVVAVAAEFGVTRQAVNAHLRALVAGKSLRAAGRAPHRRYTLANRRQKQAGYALAGLTEDRVWSDFKRHFDALSQDETDICHYGFTEIVNNAIEHSRGDRLTLRVRHTAVSVEINVADDGVGIFQKVASALGLTDPRESVIELAKGKLTTDPAHHTGEGVFFTSRIFDRFALGSENIRLVRLDQGDQWRTETESRATRGTLVTMSLLLPAGRTLEKVFSAFSSGPEDYEFARTLVPLKLAALGEDALISRSQARRILQRVDRFREVALDFAGIRTIGQGFADEIFRVFANAHPHVRLTPLHANEQVHAMIRRASKNTGPAGR
ncbi:MAG TPA: DUF4325 domain-containing protein [Tepidisphaeraceae bacterium]|nr:DUF4325 domain-containing protein [Tepidisphaeraceae bacterium]